MSALADAFVSESREFICTSSVRIFRPLVSSLPIDQDVSGSIPEYIVYISLVKNYSLICTDKMLCVFVFFVSVLSCVVLGGSHTGETD